MIPKLNRYGDGYTLRWDDHNINITVTRIHTKTNEVHAQVSIVANISGLSHPLRSVSNVNLSSDVSRKTLAKKLDSWQQDIPWDVLIEQMCILVLQALQEGEPVYEVSGEENVAPLSYLIYPFVQIREPTLIYGDPGICKSYICTYLAMCAQLPIMHNSANLQVQDTPTNILYLDYESTWETMSRRIKALRAGMDIPPVSIYYRSCWQPFSADLPEIQIAVDSYDIGCIIIDSVGVACAGELNGPQGAVALFRSIRKLGVSCLAITHSQKPQEGKPKSSFGSIYFDAGARQVWEFAKSQDEGSNTVDIACIHRKSNNSRLSHPVGLQVSFDSDDHDNLQGVRIESSDARNNVDLLSRMSTKTRIIEYLREVGTASVNDISEALGISAELARKTLNRYKAVTFARVDNTRWGLQYDNIS